MTYFLYRVHDKYSMNNVSSAPDEAPEDPKEGKAK